MSRFDHDEFLVHLFATMAGIFAGEDMDASEISDRLHWEYEGRRRGWSLSPASADVVHYVAGPSIIGAFIPCMPGARITQTKRSLLAFSVTCPACRTYIENAGIPPEGEQRGAQPEQAPHFATADRIG